ncbi:Bifunctional bis(5'-adenosyl)-triphosphatase/adenylylsulfatase FHIT [Zea mays]|nr:Bifunctional bis(5'-adenosyl)-triphosphatase/adenylylsulfatase FHIT [Zea mays]
MEEMANEANEYRALFS